MSGRTTEILNVRVPVETYRQFAEEAGEGYGARSALFRDMVKFWFDHRDARAWKARHAAEVTRRVTAEQRLELVRRALDG